MVKGKVKWFNPQKGYGFIQMDDGKDIFVHHSEIQDNGFRTLDEDQRVEFEIRQNTKGEYAASVVKI